MLIAILKIIVSVALMAVAAIAIAHTAMQSKWLSSQRIPHNAYILVSEGKRSIAFRDHDTAVAYWKRAFKRGVRYKIYEVKNGKILRVP